MHRRKFLAGIAGLLANQRVIRAFPRNLSSSPATPVRLDESAEGQPVNLLRYGRIQSWLNPEITSLLQSQLGSQNSNSEVLQFSELQSEVQEFDIGVEWPEFRTVQEIVVRFSGAVPHPDRRVLEIWNGITGLQGSWKSIAPGPDDRVDGGVWKVKSTGQRTCKVRLRILGNRQGAVEAFEVRGPSCWKTGKVHIEWGHESPVRPHDGHLEAYNGEILGLTSVGRTVLLPDGSWRGEAGNGSVSGITVKLLYTSGLDVDRTILTLRTKAADFSFLPREALEEQPIYLPDFGVFIRNSDSNLSSAEYRQRHADDFRITDAVTKLPEQTLEQAYGHIRADRVVAFVGVDCNSQKFGITPSGNWVIGYDDPRFGRIINPQFSFYFDNYELPTAFAPRQAVPDSLFRAQVNKNQHLAEGWLPIVTTKWGSASDVTYERTDFAALPGHTASIDQSKLTGDELSVMVSRLKIRNDSPAATTICFCIRPFRPDQGNAPYGAVAPTIRNAWSVGLANDCINVEGNTRPHICRIDIKQDLLINACTTVEENTRSNICHIDVNGKGSLHLEPSIGAIRYSLQLSANEQHEIYMVVPGRPLPDSETGVLKSLQYQKLYDQTIEYWKTLLAKGMKLELPDEHLQNLYNANLHHFLISFTKDSTRDEYYANTAAFIYGAIGSESSPIIQALDMRGMHHHAKKCLDAFLSTQGDAVPDGEYKSQEGGFYHYWPWYSINQGFVLWALAEHYFYSGDKEWLKKVAPQVVAGCEFIVRGRKLTKKELPDGGRPISYGFAPAGSIGDPRSWRYSFMVSGFFYLGLKKAAEALQDVDPENASRFATEAADFLAAIRTGLKESTALSPATRLRDGTSVPSVPSFVTARGFSSDMKDNADPDLRFSYASDSTAGALQLVKCEVLGPSEPETDWLVNVLEDRFFMFSPPRSRVQLENISLDWFNLGGFDKMQPYYLGYPDVYLQRDQVANFLRAFFNTLASISDNQNLSFQEALEGNGGQPQKTHEEARFIQQLRMMLIMEMQGDLFLARGTPRSWLEDGEHISVEDAPSHFGDLSFRIQSFANQNRIEATVHSPSRRRPAHLYLRLRHPKEARLERVIVNGRQWSDFDAAKEWISLPLGIDQITVQAHY
jgi:hypothetical protein